MLILASFLFVSLLIAATVQSQQLGAKGKKVSAQKQPAVLAPVIVQIPVNGIKLVLPAAPSPTATPTDTLAVRTLWATIVAAIANVVLAIAAFLQIKGLKEQSRIADKQAETAEKQGAIAEAQATIAAETLRETKDSRELGQLPCVSVSIEDVDDGHSTMLDNNTDIFFYTVNNNVTFRNTGNAPAIEVQFNFELLNPDECGFTLKPQEPYIGTLGIGEMRTISYQLVPSPDTIFQGDLKILSGVPGDMSVSLYYQNTFERLFETLATFEVHLFEKETATDMKLYRDRPSLMPLFQTIWKKTQEFPQPRGRVRAVNS